MLFRIGIFATVMLATCSAATAQVKVRIGDLAQSLNEIGSRVMIDQGIDKKYGIAAEYKAYPTLDGLFTAIRGKDVDVGFWAPAEAGARKRPTPTRAAMTIPTPLRTGGILQQLQRPAVIVAITPK